MDNKKQIAVAGTGYVGLSLAVLLSQHNDVTAVDIVPEKVDMLNSWKSPIKDEYIEKFLAEHPEKPFLCCEYTHSMGNSNGGMHKYTELTEREPRYQGGFIWDFVDQAIAKKDRYGKEFLAYGGDFGDRSSDYNFSGDGILYADRKLTAKLQDVKFNYQNFHIDVEADGVTIENISLFTDAGEYDLHYELLLDGKKIWEKTEPAPHVLPGEKQRLELDFLPVTDAGEECLTVSLVLKEDMSWAKRGYETAFGQGVWQVEEVEVTSPAEAVEAAEVEEPAHYTAHLPLTDCGETPLHAYNARLLSCSVRRRLIREPYGRQRGRGRFRNR